ncbi:TIR domain-containing protein [candidate division KSB1 bacterium]|nr:TIR domain-containing protein [candidate division KSB1 bacterium]
MKPKLFISYSHKDKAFALELSDALQNEGADVFIDKWEIKIGDYFLDKIFEAINESNFIVAVLSYNSVQSKWVLLELKEAKKLEKQDKKTLILPIKIDDCTVPEVLQDKNYADFASDYNEAFNELLMAIGGKKPKIDDPQTLVQELAEAKTADGRNNLLDIIYDTTLDIDNNWIHKKIADNIIAQISTDKNQYGMSLDVDTGKLIDRIPLIFKASDQLVFSLQNIHTLIEKGADTIKEYYNVVPDATFATDPFFRTLVVDCEARIKTDFRTVLPIGRMDVDSGERKPEVLKIKTVDELVGNLRTRLKLNKMAGGLIKKLYKLEGVPVRQEAKSMGIEEWFFPTAGYNII